jgi:hypothetical protein
VDDVAGTNDRQVIVTDLRSIRGAPQMSGWRLSSSHQRRDSASARRVDCSGRPAIKNGLALWACSPGVGFVEGGALTAHTGLSATAGWFLTSATVMSAVSSCN